MNGEMIEALYEVQLKMCMLVIIFLCDGTHMSSY